MTSFLLITSFVKLLPFISMSSGLGSTSKAVKPSTSSNSLDWNLATNVDGPAYGGVYLKVQAATPFGGISAIYKE